MEPSIDPRPEAGARELRCQVLQCVGAQVVGDAEGVDVGVEVLAPEVVPVEVALVVGDEARCAGVVGTVDEREIGIAPRSFECPGDDRVVGQVEDPTHVEQDSVDCRHVARG